MDFFGFFSFRSRSCIYFKFPCSILKRNKSATWNLQLPLHTVPERATIKAFKSVRLARNVVFVFLFFKKHFSYLSFSFVSCSTTLFRIAKAFSTSKYKFICVNLSSCSRYKLAFPLPFTLLLPISNFPLLHPKHF